MSNVRRQKRPYDMHKRTHIRGVVFAVVLKLTALLALAYVGAKVTKFIAESNGVPSPLATGPFEVYSLGWYISQVVGVLVGLLAGCVCARYAPQNTWRAPAILVIGYLILSAVSAPSETGWAFGLYWVLANPISLLLGVAAYKFIESARAA
jgi:hypothetical protein